MVFLLVRVHVSVRWWAGCFTNLWVRQGNPGGGQGGRCWGCSGKRRKGGTPWGADGARDQEVHNEGLEKGGHRRGTERRGGKEGIQIAHFVGFF